eukprot:m.78964 g.78964  ORF g.78964 m.78964 type:complete len:157 (+) comp11974_c0_seq5:42-512(+)
MALKGVYFAVFAAVVFATISSVCSESEVLDSDASVPFIPRLMHDNGSVVVNMPLSKSVIFTRHTREDIDVSSLEEDIVAVTSGVADAAETISSVTDTLATLASPEQVASLSAQLQSLNFAADQTVEKHKIEGISVSENYSSNCLSFLSFKCKFSTR